MVVVHDLPPSITDSDSVVTIGAFDGIHLGHQALIRQLVNRARTLRCQAALITFHPHPAEVLPNREAPRYLTTLSEKLAILEELGIDLVAVLAFTRQLAGTSAEDFLAQVCEALHMRELWVGPQFALGRDREGDIPRVRTLGPAMGFTLQVAEPVRVGGERVTSSRIRKLVLEGKVREAARLLGRFYSVTGRVVHGDHRGRTLGFPTANLKVEAQRIMPPDGVYAGYGWAQGERYETVMSLGRRPTFGKSERMLEVYLFDFRGDLYGMDLKVEFVARLRSEVKFESVQALVAQIRRDKARAQEVLAVEDEAR